MHFSHALWRQKSLPQGQAPRGSLPVHCGTKPVKSVHQLPGSTPHPTFDPKASTFPLTQAGLLASGGMMRPCLPTTAQWRMDPYHAGYSGGTARDFHPIPC